MKTVLITGATSGIGEALLARYHQQGFYVIACGRNREKLAAYLDHYEHIQVLAFDMTNKDETEEAVKTIEQLDILILNAGDCAYIDDARAFDPELFSRIVTTNLIAPGYLLHYLLPKLTSGGQLVFISSSATILPFPRAEAYGASKAGLDYLANSLRIDLTRENIAVTLVHPGFIKTPLTDRNTFAMPFMLSSEQAAREIFDGVSRRKQYLHFPWRLTLILKFLALLPDVVWQKVITRNTEA
ncbi:SDR family NAD(P)-dependent oxidoreductase [Thalassomonas viridans]|uniref:SDR family NAD(P)-dependent oxidoreductase n=1 Tax=Thalassomonas viridans TaxID=137584 RepID=A0AAF0C6B4_9GAMM|nr:SDR family NAD(P)-dependent oxidoreductase [Thalassomonas viridans]WDE04182.1 SDR family NAD(P)-dependent oxidoreductase [Thalassomonas viridans]